MMRPILAAVLAGVLAFAGAANAQGTKRTEIKGGTLTGTNMQIHFGIVEVPPGAMIPRHKHAGEEIFYVLEGANIKTFDGKDTELKTGFGNIIPRDTVHAGITVVGPGTLKILAVHVIDPGPIQIPVPKQ